MATLVTSGTGWAIDTTADDLSADIYINDFTVTIAAVPVALSNFTKITSRSVLYTGPSIGSSTVILTKSAGTPGDGSNQYYNRVRQLPVVSPVALRSASSNTSVFLGTQSAAAGASIVALGFNAGNAATSGDRWTAVGALAGQSNTIGTNWVAVGFNSGVNNTSGTGWTAVGVTAGADSTTGNNNTFLGSSAGRGITTGSGNTILGANLTGLAAGLTNTVVIGSGDGVRKLLSDSLGTLIGNSNADSQLRLYSPDGTIWRIQVTNAGVLTIAV
jgi:hypothetical protein